MNSFTAYMNTLPDVADRDTQSLERIVNDFPASSLARMLLLKKYQESEDEGFDKLKLESALYVSNIPWYLFVLSQSDKRDEEETGHFAVAIPDPSPDPDKIIAGEDLQFVSEDQGEKDLSLQPPPEAPSDEEDHAGAEVSHEDETAMDMYDAPAEESSSADVGDELDHSLLPETTANAEADTNGEQETDEELSVPVWSEDPSETVSTIDEPGSAAPVQSATDDQEQQIGQELSEEIQDDSQAESDQRDDVKDHQPEELEEQTGQEVPDESRDDLQVGSGQPDDVVHQQHEESSALQTADSEVDEDEGTGPLAFEPLHTIDYFASQGIRLTEEDLRDDRLSQQVKSFTGWLKSMKRLHPGRLPEQNEVIERIIQNAAEVSNVEADVFTEAMAEVLVKQNKKEKAVEMYHKLSLMNPSKSAYFAAKIENLKNS